MHKNISRVKDGIKNTEYFFIGIFSFIVISMLILMMIYIPSVNDLVYQHARAEVIDAAASGASAAQVYFSSKLEFLESAANEFREIDDIYDEDSVRDVCVWIRDAGDFRHIGFTRLDGITVSSQGGVANTSNRLFIQEGLNGKQNISPRMACDFDGKISDMYTVPVFDKKGALIGALTGDCTPFAFSDIKLLDISGDTSCFFVFNSSGDVIFSDPVNKAGIGSTDNLLSLITDEKDSKEIGYILNSHAHNEYMEFAVEDVRYTSSFIGLDGMDWTFVAIMPKDLVLTSLSGLVSLSVWLIVVMSALLLLSMIVIMIRISRIKTAVYEAVDESEKHIYSDSVTGHETMAKFRERYSSAMKDSTSGHALVSLDIDHFKAVNDMFGFDGGNEIIRKLSDIIKRNIGKTDFFARGGGDLFYVFKEYSDMVEIIDLVTRIMADVEYQITEVKLDLAIGIYVIEDPHISSRVAADRADMARDSVKNSKQSRFSFFNSAMLNKIRREKKIEDMMEDSLALGEFMVYLQPKFSLGDKNEVVGAEALVRWKHEDKIIPPNEFIPLFEKNGFVTKLDYYMFEEVCKLQKKYLGLGLKPNVISVNMSRLHIHKAGFVSDLAAICEKYAIDTKYLEIEITESAAFEDVDILRDIFREIKGYGFHVSIDDFGTGYSSLNMLKDLPVDVIKIDRSFLTENADENENASRIIGCVVSLASALNINTICEGIETKGQADLLTKLGCNMAQGFYFARPMPVADYEALAYASKRK